MLGPAWRTLDIIEKLEQDLGVPVMHAVPAQCWDIQRHLHVRQPVKGFGRLSPRCPDRDVIVIRKRMRAIQSHCRRRCGAPAALTAPVARRISIKASSSPSWSASPRPAPMTHRAVVRAASRQAPAGQAQRHRPQHAGRRQPGGGQSLYNSAPKDGTTLGVIGGGMVMEPFSGNPQGKYDPRRFNWIGGRTRDNFLCLVWHTVPVTTAAGRDTARNRGRRDRPGLAHHDLPHALNEFVGTKFRVVAGYPGGNEVPPRWRTRESRRLLRLVARQHQLPRAGLAAEPQDRPLASSRSPRAGCAEHFRSPMTLPATRWRARRIEVLESDSGSAWPSIAPPDCRTSASRSCARPSMRPRGRRASGRSRRIKLEIDPVRGDELQQVVEQAVATPKEVLDLVRRFHAAK